MTSPSELEHRIRRLEDRAEIQDLAIRYCVAIDSGDYEGLAEMYTEKATLGEIVGRHEVVDTLKSIRATYGRTIHSPDAHTVTLIDDDHATGLVLSHAELDIAGVNMQTAIRYHDDYERGEDGVWRFANRALKFDYALPVAQMAESMTAELPVRWPGADPAGPDPI